MSIYLSAYTFALFRGVMKFVSEKSGGKRFVIEQIFQRFASGADFQNSRLPSKISFVVKQPASVKAFWV